MSDQDQYLMQNWGNDSVNKFAEEMYARSQDTSQPVERTGPVTVTVQQGTAMTISSGESPDEPLPVIQSRSKSAEVPQQFGRARQPEPVSIANLPSPKRSPGPDESQAGTRRTPDNSNQEDTRRTPGTISNDQGQEIARKVSGTVEDTARPPALKVLGGAEFRGQNPVKFERPPQVWDEKKHEWYTPDPWTPKYKSGVLGATPATVFLGKASAVSSDMITMNLYGDGSNYPPTSTVPVEIVDPGSAATVQAGDWVSPVFAFNNAEGKFYYQTQPVSGSTGSEVYLGKVNGSVGSGIYSVDLYGRGAENPSTLSELCYEASGATDVSDGTWVVVLKIKWTDDGGVDHVSWEFTNPGTKSSTSVFLGKVTGGSGNTYTVALYGNGSSASPTDTVTATVPQIDVNEAIPVDTWIAAVHKFGSGESVTYEFQPPVWL